MSARPRSTRSTRPLADALPTLRAWLALPVRPLLRGPRGSREADEPAGAAWHAPFIAALCATGLTSEACRAAGITIRDAYDARARDGAFDAAWRETQRAYRSARQRNEVRG